MLTATRARRWSAPLATATNTKKGQLTKNQLSLLHSGAARAASSMQLCWSSLPLYYGLLRFSCALQLVIAVLAEIGQNQLMLL